MKSVVVASSSLVLLLLACEISAQSYGIPEQSSGGYGQQPSGGQIHKHIFVHVAPDEVPEPRPARPYTPPPKPDKHYQIIFVKAPTPPTPEQQEIELPPLPETKSLIYVLLKRPEIAPEPIIKPAPPTKPSKPEVYFIRYKNQEQKGGYGAPSSPPSNQYGSPF